MAADGAGHGKTAESSCVLFQCFCRRRVSCSDNIHRFGPGRGYLRVQDGAGDDRPLWSVLVGCSCADFRDPLHNIRLHRFRVASSGRVIGRSNDMLQPFVGVHPDEDDLNPGAIYDSGTAALAPDGRRLHVICSHSRALRISDGKLTGVTLDNLFLPAKVAAVDLVDRTVSPLAPLPFPTESYSYHAVSAHGELWAPAVVVGESPGTAATWRLVVHRLVVADEHGGGSSWEEVAGYQFPERPGPVGKALFSGPALPGYAVVDDRFILLSIIGSTFFSFDCAAGTLTKYVLLSGRAVNVQEDGNGGTIYFVCDTTLYAYKLSPWTADTPVLEPPVVVENLWPYYKEGYGYITQLTGRMLCAVWINMCKVCSCATRHALITTFRVTSAAPKPDEGSSSSQGGSSVHSVEVLHSTCRRVDMFRNELVESDCFGAFDILQEYPDVASSEPGDDDDPSSSPMVSQPQAEEDKPQGKSLLKCCRNYLIGQGELEAYSLVDCKAVTKPDVYFICQAGQHSHLYQISTSEGKLTCDRKVLEPQLSLDTIRDGDVGLDDPVSWHFVHHGSELLVIPSSPHRSHYKVDVSTSSYSLVESKQRDGINFSAVLRAGGHVVALGYTLSAVYILDQETFQWIHCETSSKTLDLGQTVKISGFVDLIDDGAFLISEADTGKCFLLDMRRREWFVAEPPPGVSEWFGWVGFLRWRCIFDDGFIYTCSDEGLVAIELVKDGGVDSSTTSYSLGMPILLEFPWRKFSDTKFMSFERIGRDTVSGDLVFCVIQGYFIAEPFTDSHSLTATTVIVERRDDTGRGKKVPVGINHVDVAVSSVEHEGCILTNYAFAL